MEVYCGGGNGWKNSLRRAKYWTALIVVALKSWAHQSMQHAFLEGGCIGADQIRAGGSYSVLEAQEHLLKVYEFWWKSDLAINSYSDILPSTWASNQTDRKVVCRSAVIEITIRKSRYE
ncbi:MAG: hypothetical protein R3C61_27675 [Bacteroidia bacterium]